MKRTGFSTAHRYFCCRSACNTSIARSTFCRQQVRAIATGEWRLRLLPARGTRRHAFGTYEAANYDELIDCPVEMGEFQLGRFSVLDTPHEIVITGRVPKLDMARTDCRSCSEYAKRRSECLSHALIRHHLTAIRF